MDAVTTMVLVLVLLPVRTGTGTASSSATTSTRFNVRVLVRVLVPGVVSSSSSSSPSSMMILPSGQNRNALFDGEYDAQNENALDAELSLLQHLVSNETVPWTSAKMNHMQCIPYDADSAFAKKNPNAKARDVWWSHLQVEYPNVNDHTVMSKAVTINRMLP